MEFVSIDTWTLIFTWINLLILFLIMKKLLFKPITNIIKQREEEVGLIYEKAEAAQRDAEGMRIEYTNKLSEANNEAGRIIKGATVYANEKSEEIVSEAKDAAEQIKLKAEKEIEQEKKKAIDEAKCDIASIAITIAEKIIERDIKNEDHERLIEEFINTSGDVK